MWELSSGELLLSILFDVEIMSVTFDPCEYFLFCGGSDGNIFQVSLCSQVSFATFFIANCHQHLQLCPNFQTLKCSQNFVVVQINVSQLVLRTSTYFPLKSPQHTKKFNPVSAVFRLFFFFQQSLSRDKSFQADHSGNQVFKGHR